MRQDLFGIRSKEQRINTTAFNQVLSFSIVEHIQVLIVHSVGSH